MYKGRATAGIRAEREPAQAHSESYGTKTGCWGGDDGWPGV